MSIAYVCFEKGRWIACIRHLSWLKQGAFLWTLFKSKRMYQIPIIMWCMTKHWSLVVPLTLHVTFCAHIIELRQVYIFNTWTRTLSWKNQTAAWHQVFIEYQCLKASMRKPVLCLLTPDFWQIVKQAVPKLNQLCSRHQDSITLIEVIFTQEFNFIWCY